MPSKRLAEAALVRILRLLETFDFVSRDDRAVALSLIFTAVARRGLNFVPLQGFDAPVAGSGKSMLVDIASILATGHEAGVIAQGESREEAEKRLSAILMRGDPLIAIDNCELPLEGVVLNQALLSIGSICASSATRKCCGRRPDRSFPRPATTSSSRATSPGGRSSAARSEMRTARTQGVRLRPHCRRQGASRRVVVAILTALLAYHAAGRPNRPRPPLQSFVPSSDTVRGASSG